jgi:MoaA/NifB/PqqE/SkfB family radical SAM enzyme
VSVSFVVQKGNYSEIRRFAEQAAAIGFDNVEFVGLGLNRASHALALSPPEEAEAALQVREAQHLLARAGISTNARHYLSCSRSADWSRTVFSHTPCCVGHFFCRVLADGSVDPCGVSRRVVGDITRQEVRDIWSSPAYRAFREEAFRLPALGHEVGQAACYTCGHALRADAYHDRMRAGAWPDVL